MKRILLILLLCIPICLQAQKTVTTDQAKDYADKGTTVTVCGLVVGIHYADKSNGKPTFVNLDKSYPNQVFTILIWGEDLSKFPVQPSGWQGKKVCATGTVTQYRNIPEIVAKSPQQITFRGRKRAIIRENKCAQKP